jgi:hypothetical protein
MALIVLNHPMDFPAGRLHRALAAHLRNFRWQCGEGDMGQPGDMVAFDREQLISGRLGDEIVFLSVKWHGGQVPGAPERRFHISTSLPTTEDQDLAARIRIILCATLMFELEDQAHCQLVDGGTWLSRLSVLEILDALDRGGLPVELERGFPGPSADDWNEAESVCPPEAPLPEPVPAPFLPRPAFVRRPAASFGRKHI